eukprot:GHVS01067677.1.p1 GENE.GHVS01067677.1~~GHVS01067677.1.p1  ORF type:complete len:120 (+),score=16.21 GHVS01067677.1:182-541(+)
MTGHNNNNSGQVCVSHLLIKHAGSRNPVSRRTNKPVTITKEEALTEIHGYKAKINTDNFGEHCHNRSDCGSYAKSGDLGMFGKGQMQRPFEDASYSLSVGEISGIVDTDSGLHILYRTA